MSRGSYIAADKLITSQPCKLYSVLITTAGEGTGYIKLYDAWSAETARLMLDFLCPASNTIQATFRGLDILHGLYANIGGQVYAAFIEWEPVEQVEKSA